MGRGGFCFKVVFSWVFLSNLLSLAYCSLIYNITSSSPLLQGQILSSPGEVFELGFFSGNSSHFQYVGIWFKEISPRTVVWVANRENPVTDSSASLTIGSDGNLLLLDGKKSIIWSTNITNPSNDSMAFLPDDGFLALKDTKTENKLWDTSLYPTDILLPGKLLVYNKTNGYVLNANSWKSENDPSPGEFYANVPPYSPGQVVIWEGSKRRWRSGPWDKLKFTGLPEMYSVYQSGQLEERPDSKTAYFTVGSLQVCKYTMFKLSPKGVQMFLCWASGRGWVPIWQAPLTPCDFYNACGPFGVCHRNETTNSMCKCLKGYVPKSDEEWMKGNWSGGCVRRIELNCQRNVSSNNTQGRNPDGFLKISGFKLPEYASDSMRDLDENGCHQRCLSNCSCIGYSYVTGIGCLVWGGELVDMVELPGGPDLSLRLAYSDLVDGGGHSTKTKIIVSILAVLTAAIIATMIYGFWKWRSQKKVIITDKMNSSRGKLQSFAWRSDSDDKDSVELPLFDFDSILVATNHFGLQNKLGQGGYGPVYKGKLLDGKDVAIKRLSSSSGQGLEEFKNEVKLISKLQHRNLVKLVGCCIEKEEKILIYEYMPNKSLDAYLFVPARKAELDWKTRINIIVGVAQGLLYLHRDSCLRVIHRDLKVSNILLDGKMNPKISDFGLARIFEGTLDLGSTRRVVGTLGYMAPEYLLGGVFSEKSDVFGFGVLILEIVSGRKVNSSLNNDQNMSLVAYAWESWCNTSGVEMVDQSLGKSFSRSKASHLVKIGLLCVQDNAADRPTMADVVSMLSGEKAKLPEPKQPTFAFQNVLSNSTFSENYLTESVVEPR